MRLFLALVLTAAICGPAYADDIKLKDGRVLTNVKVLKKTQKYWRIELVDGNRMRIDPADVIEHVEKETVGDVFQKKQAEIGRKDAKALFELAKWGMEQGCTKHAKKVLARVIKLEPEHAEARAMLGHVKCDDGRWRYGKALERYQAKKEEARLTAMGWVKVKGRMVDPFTAKCLNAGLVEHEGRWYTKEDLAKVKRGMFQVDGVWYEAKEKEKVDGGQRKVGAGWVSIADLDEKHRNDDDPWEIPSEHFLLVSSISYDKNKALLEQLEMLWKPLTELCGDAPLTVGRDDKLKIVVRKNLDSYREFSQKHTVDDRTSLYSSALGGFYSPRDKIVVTYYYSMEYLAQWTQHGAAHAFLDAIGDYRRMPSNMYEAIGAYFQGFHGGTYRPYESIWWNGLREWKPERSPREILNAFILDPRGKSAQENERDMARIGMAFRFLQGAFPDIVKAWMRKYIRGSAAQPDLMEAIEVAAAGRDLEAEFAEYVAEFLKGYEKPRLE